MKEYLTAIAEKRLFTACFDPVDSAADKRIKVGDLTPELGNPFQRPAGNGFNVFSGAYLDADGQRLAANP